MIFFCPRCSIKTEKKNASASSFRSRREAELGDLQRRIEDETRRHETQLSELRIKHTAALDNLQEQLDNSKRVRVTRPYLDTLSLTFECAH